MINLLGNIKLIDTFYILLDIRILNNHKVLKYLSQYKLRWYLNVFKSNINDNI